MKLHPLLAALIAPVALISLLGCGDKDATGDDTAGQGATTDTGMCATAPVITWNNGGEGLMIENCQPCHASTSTNRNGAPDDVTFDTLDETLAHRDRILARATGPEPTMPPQGGVSDEDREKLEIWLTCWE